MVNVRFEAQAEPPSRCVTLVLVRAQLPVAETCAWTLASVGKAALAGLQPRLPPVGTLINTGGLVATNREASRVYDPPAAPPPIVTTWVSEQGAWLIGPPVLVLE